MQEKKSKPRSFIVLTSMLKLFQPELRCSSVVLMGELRDGEGIWVSGEGEAVRESVR